MLRYLNYWDGVETFDLDSFTKKDVFRAIALLNGENISGVSLTLDSGAMLGIGGGADKQFICMAYLPGETEARWLISETGDNAKIYEINYDIDVATIPEDYVVGFEQLHEAVTYFCETGKLATQMTWRNEHDNSFNPWE